MKNNIAYKRAKAICMLALLLEVAKIDYKDRLAAILPKQDYIGVTNYITNHLVYPENDYNWNDLDIEEG